MVCQKTYTSYTRGCRCIDCTEAWRIRCAAYRQRAGTFRRTHTCSDCGAEWTSSSPKGVRCKECALALRRVPPKSRELVYVGPAVAATYCELPERHPARQAQRPPRVWYAGLCGHCDESFVDIQPAARYCSRACSRGASKRRAGYFSVSPKLRLAIYERDDWTCQLCIEPVEPSLPPSDPWAATLDHIRCQSWDEIPDHSPSNLRLAHRWCNSVRGDETYYTAAVLVA